MNNVRIIGLLCPLLSITTTINTETITIIINNNTHYNFTIKTKKECAPKTVCYEQETATIRTMQTKQVAWINAEHSTKTEPYDCLFFIALHTKNLTLNLAQKLIYKKTNAKNSYELLYSINTTDNDYTWHQDNYRVDKLATPEDGQASFQVTTKKYHTKQRATIIEYTITENSLLPQEMHAEEIRMLTWNVDLKPLAMTKNGQLERSTIIPEYVKGYDVVLFTEIFDPSAIAIVQKRLIKEYPYYTHNSKNGVIIVSKWPFEKTDIQPFKPLCTGLDCSLNKGVVYTAITKQATRIHIFGLTLQDWPSNRAALVRNEQIKKVAEFIKKQQISAQEPVIIAGSFNINRYKSSFDDKKRNEYSEMLTVLGAELGVQEGHRFTVDPSINGLSRKVDPKEYTDYILYLSAYKKPKKFSTAVRIFKTPKPWQDRPQGPVRDLSSHFALAGTFEF